MAIQTNSTFPYRMHQTWENSASANKIGSTSIMSNPFEQQQNPWFNPHTMQIKSEPMDFNLNARVTPPLTARHEMSPVLPQSALDLLEKMPSFRQMGVFNPLTPPGYSGLLFPQFLSNQQLPKQTTPSRAQDLSKSKLNQSNETSSMTPPMDVTPPKSPLRMEQTPEKDEQHFNGLETRSSIESYDEESDDYDDDGLSVGGEKSKKRKTSNGKPRQYKCKQCKKVFFSKAEFWDHTRSHIKPEKM